MPDFTKELVDDFFQVLFTRFEAGITRVDTFWRQFSTVVPITTQVGIHRWLNQLPSVREWLGARVVKNVSTSGFTVVNKEWESTVSLSVRDWKDDNHGLYTTLVDMLVTAAARHKDRLAAELLIDNTAIGFDGLTLFNAAHDLDGTSYSNQDTGGGAQFWYLIDGVQPLKPVLMQEREDFSLVSLTDPSSDNVFFNKEFVWGVEAVYNVAPGFWPNVYRSNQTLNEANLDAAMQVMRATTDKNGDPLGIKPDTIMFGISNTLAANKLLGDAFIANGGTNTSRGRIRNLIDNDFLP